jgi:protein-S-isoprenylcysteine O-methyltransferase Ste14
MNSSGLAKETQIAASKIERRVRIACVLALMALGLIVFSLLVPKPLPVIVAMSVAQAVGTLSFVIFLYVVSKDVWRVMGGKTPVSKEESPSEEPPAV